MGHYAKCCRSARNKNHIADEKTYSAEEDDWVTDRIYSIQQKIRSMGTKNKNGLPFYTKTLLVNNPPIKFIVYTGSPVTLIPKTEVNKITTTRPVVEDTGKIKSDGKTTTSVEIDGKTRQLELLITTRQTHSLLRLKWMEKLGITLRTEAPNQTINQIDQRTKQLTNRTRI